MFGTKGTASSSFLDPATGDATFREALRLLAEDFARSVTASRADRRTSPASDGSLSPGASVADAIAALQIASLADAGTSQLAP